MTRLTFFKMKMNWGWFWGKFIHKLRMLRGCNKNRISCLAFTQIGDAQIRISYTHREQSSFSWACSTSFTAAPQQQQLSLPYQLHGSTTAATAEPALPAPRQHHSRSSSACPTSYNAATNEYALVHAAGPLHALMHALSHLYLIFSFWQNPCRFLAATKLLANPPGFDQITRKYV